MPSLPHGANSRHALDKIPVLYQAIMVVYNILYVQPCTQDIYKFSKGLFHQNQLPSGMLHRHISAIHLRVTPVQQSGGRWPKSLQTYMHIPCICKNK